MSLNPDLSGLPSLASATAQAPDTCACGSTRFDYHSTGDGGVVRECERCRSVAPIGRYWVDAALGPRALSVWSSLRTS